MLRPILFTTLALLASTAAYAKHHDDIAAPSTAAPATAAPKLIIAISVDQYSANLFDEYRPTFTGGLKRLSTGIVFNNGYQTHAATETCPGHSTILTGDHPSRTGIIANNWIDLSAKRADKGIYCSEDETIPGSDSKNYTVSAVHLKVPTLGERLKALNPATRVVSVSGKDRATIMMGGHNIDQAWWWTSRNNSFQFVSFTGKTPPAPVVAANANLIAMIKAGYRYALPDSCKSRVSPIDFPANGITIGTARADMPAATDPTSFATAGGGLYTHPALDQATLDIALGFIDEMKLGQGSAPDVLSIGLSVTDPVGHAFGTEGPEMCSQMVALDAALGSFLAKLDATGVNYEIVLTADHGGHDIPERKGAPADIKRLDSSARPTAIDIAVGGDLKLNDRQLIYADNGDGAGNFYVAKDIVGEQRAAVIASARKHLLESPFVAAVFTRDEIAAAPAHPALPTDWTLLQRVAASSDPQRSGDLYVVMKEGTQTVVDPSTTVMAHGSVWDYDRRVPIIFYSKGMTNGSSPTSEIETIDIMPTLAAMVGLKLAPGDVDGKCLATVAGALCTQ